MSQRFAIRSLFLTVTIAAICIQLMLKSDWLAACGFVASACTIIVAIRLKLVANWLRFLLVVAGTGLMWFVVVDYSISTNWCYRCWDHRFYGQYRIFGIPLHSEYGPYHRQPRSQLRSDLGSPCNHRFEHEVRIRLWGLFYGARPFFRGTCCISAGPDYYTEDVSRRVRQFAEDNPEEALQLIELITKDDDGGAAHAFILRMQTPL